MTSLSQPGNRHRHHASLHPALNSGPNSGPGSCSNSCRNSGFRSGFNSGFNSSLNSSFNSSFNYRTRGFTLVEIMMSLGLTALLLALLSSGVYIVADDWNRNADSLENSLDEALTILQLDRALHGAFPHSFTNEETLSRQIYFTGEDDYLSFVSTVSPQRTPGLMTWEIFTEEDEGVYVTLAPAYADDPSQRLDNAEPQLLLPGYRAEFSYLYQDADEDRVWTDQWLAEELLALPMAIYIRFEPLDEDANSDVLEVLARVRNNEHRSIEPNRLALQAL